MNDAESASRRTFLKIAGAGFLGTAVAGSALGEAKSAGKNLSGAASSISHVTTKQVGQLVHYVNPLQGTDSSVEFSRGNTLPIVAMPFGMTHWTLQTRDQIGWFYRPSDRRVEGIRATHQLSPWLADYGYACFLPFVGEPSLEPAARASSYRPEEMSIAPHAVHLRLQRYRCSVDLAPTERCAIMRITFNESGSAGLIFDLPGTDASVSSDGGSGLVSGVTHANDGGVPSGFGTYYAVEVDRPLTGFEVKTLKKRKVAVLRFRVEAGRPVLIRIGSSFIDGEQAIRNLKSEIGSRGLEEIRDTAEANWEKMLARLRVDGGTESQRRILYSGLYRVLLFPRIWHEVDKAGETVHFSPYDGTVRPGVMYADHGYWDVYHAWYPLMSVLYPDRLGQILQAWVNASKEGGWMPQFPCPGYRACMTGSLIDAVFADAAVKHIAGYDLQAAYDALKHHATQAGNPEKGYGRRGIEHYLKLGYIPCDLVPQGTAETLDSAYGDFCISQIADVLGNRADAEFFKKRSQNWRNVFDSNSGWMKGRKADGSWQDAFNPIAWGGAFVEGSAWQHRFAVPHDPDGLVSAMGGKKKFVEELERMLTIPPDFEVGTYGREIHEMSEMAAVNFGQYAHSNQPVHQFLYMFAAAGQASRTQYWVRRVMNELYTPDAFAGDEDTGSMSAWYVLSALGFYSLCPGKPEYILGSPLFERAILSMQGGKQTTIEARNNGKSNFYVDHVKVKGVAHTDAAISHSVIAGGADVVFLMRNTPA